MPESGEELKLELVDQLPFYKPWIEVFVFSLDLLIQYLISYSFLFYDGVNVIVTERLTPDCGVIVLVQPTCNLVECPIFIS